MQPENTIRPTLVEVGGSTPADGAASASPDPNPASPSIPSTPRTARTTEPARPLPADLAANDRGSPPPDQTEPQPPTAWWRSITHHLRRSPLHGIEVFVALSMLIATALNSWAVYGLQRVSLDQQTQQIQLAQAALEGGDVANWRELFSSNSAQINLKTTEGRAAYAICLQAAIKLDAHPQGISYRSMLPHYDEENRAFSLARDPALLSLALKYGPKPSPPANADALWYVSVAFVNEDGRTKLEGLKARVRSDLNGGARTSEYPVQIMRVRQPDGFILTVGGLQSHETAAEIVADLKRRDVPMKATPVRSTHVVRPGDSARQREQDPASVAAPTRSPSSQD